MMRNTASSSPGVASRFVPPRATLVFDRFMNCVISVGGIGVIVAVLGIFVYIGLQILPLFRGAAVHGIKTLALPAHDYVGIGVDEWSALPFAVERDGTLLFVDLAGEGGVEEVRPALPEGATATAVCYIQNEQRLALGLAGGRFALVEVGYRKDFGAGADRIRHELKTGKTYAIGPSDGVIEEIGYGDSGTGKLAAVLVRTAAGREVHAATLAQSRSLLGAGEIKIGAAFDLTKLVEGDPVHILVSSRADGVVVATADGAIHFLVLAGKEISVRQVFYPFMDSAQKTVASMDFLLGDVSLVLTNPAGENRIFSLFVPPGGRDRLWGRTKDLPSLGSGATFYAPSMRNKAFLIGAGAEASLRFGTTAAVRWSGRLPSSVEHAVISGKFDRMLMLDAEKRLHVLALDDPHPEASFQALFGKIWYEGATEPKYDWQSTGGSDEFEPKLSMVPLIVGTAKGTMYAMLFALPVALLAAIYTSQFLDPALRRVVKPVMEIMASLPSVVLGFLAALWVAPLLERRVPSVILCLLVLPASALLFGFIWSRLPARTRGIVRSGNEFIVFLPVMALAGWAAWTAGPWFESIFFTVQDPSTGAFVSDFRRWWPWWTGSDYQQRNSMVVGFMMGFAVIPIVFTITEDSLSNVPGALRSGALALGASRWQTAMRVVVPTASAGIFSAIIIGLGRAVGETMIVVMATGNTPIMEMNIFSGMRTLSANIAVELPEAPHGGTLYRSLFLGALILFVLTFIANTVAEVLRQHLRQKYKTV